MEKLTRQQELEHRKTVIAGIRKAFEKTKHHQHFTERVANKLREELPGYTVSIGGYSTLDNIRVWGNGLPYDQSVYLCWNTSQGWVAGLEKELEIADWRDSEEWEQSQRDPDVLEQLQTLESVASAYLEHLNRIRRQAQNIIENLPIPESATVRNKRSFWTNASLETKEKFPTLFKDAKDLNV